MINDDQSLRPDYLEFKAIPDYEKLIATPLKSDEKSLLQINRILANTKIGKDAPYGHLLYVLTGYKINKQNTLEHWKNVLTHREDLVQKIGRNIGIKAAAIDYFDTIGNENEYIKKTQTSITKKDNDEDWLSRVFSYKFFQDRLQEEYQRTKRYNHSLSLVLIDVDHLNIINKKYGLKIGDLVLTRIIKIIKRSIRTVDILSRFRGDQFAVILPHANKREAYELSERIRQNVETRSKYFHEVDEGFSITASITQYTPDKTSSSQMIQRARNLLELGKSKKRNSVYSEQ